MTPDIETKIIARLHTKPDSKGIGIYNQYFQEVGSNTLYLLFQNKNPRPLLDGLKNLNILGAIPAGFEKYPGFPELVDELDEIATEVNRIGVIRQRDGKTKGFYQPAYALAEAIKSHAEISTSKIVIMGAGHVVHGFLAYVKQTGQKPREIEIYNRTKENAEKLAQRFPFVSKVGTLSEMMQTEGDVFVNASYVGSRSNKGDGFVFPESFVAAFGSIVDVAFVPMKSQLIDMANKLGLKNTPGWKTWVLQAEFCLKTMLDHQIDRELFAQCAEKEFSKELV